MAEAEPEEENETSLNIKLDYPPLPEEPTGSRDLLCRVAIRLPNNRRIQRNFLHTDPIKVTLPSNFLVSFACFPSLMVSFFPLQLLWSFCATQVEDGEKRAFHFVQPIPGASKNLEFASDLTFKEAGLANSMINLSWDWACFHLALWSRDVFQPGLEDGLVIFFPWGLTLLSCALLELGVRDKSVAWAVCGNAPFAALVLVSINTHGKT